jgi:hypothetical protein
MQFLLKSGLFAITITALAGDNIPLQKDIDVVAKQGRGSAEQRAAWDRLSLASADALPLLLQGMNTKDTAAVNWLRCAFDQIAERELKSGGKAIDALKILAFIKNPTNEGRPRRLALDLVERLQPGTAEAIYRDGLDDPEFRYEAVALVLDRAQREAKSGNAPGAVKFYRQAFDKSRDMLQARTAALGLKDGGVEVSVAKHMGFLMVWHLIGPFDGKDQKGFHLAYAPETKIDLAEELDGQRGKVHWKRYQVKETPLTSKDRHQALVNLTDKNALGNADDAVAFAYTEIHLDQPLKAEMRGAADDNFTVWVNGVKVFAFEEWRNGVRHDRHRFPIELKAGKNSVLVKICQSAAPNPEPNWEFFLRVADATGKGIAMKTYGP